MIKDWRNNFVQPSRLDEFAQYLTGNLHNYEDKEGFIPPYTDELFVEKLLIRTPTEAMHVGSILHGILENAGFSCLPNKMEKDGYKITFNIDIDLELPELREIWINGNIKNASVLGKVDAISAVTVHDHKFTSKIDTEKYWNSWQWRVYLYLTDRPKFVYNVFQIKIKDMTISVDKFERLQLEEYLTLRQEVEEFYQYYWESLNSLKDLIFEKAAKLNIDIKEK